MLESVIALLALESGLAPGTVHSTTLDDACGPQIRIDNEPAALQHVMSQSFGFGGNNCVLIFGSQTPA
jgi:3-oxoacyl-[acyl-carrier-protein] synthase-1